MIPKTVGAKALHEAAFDGDIETLTRLLDAGSEINALDATSGQTALLSAIENIEDAAVEYLLARGADPNLRGYGGVTPLQLAIEIAVEEAKSRLDSTGELQAPTTVALELLLRAGADPRQLDANGRSALDWAKRHQHAPALALLAKHLSEIQP